MSSNSTQADENRRQLEVSREQMIAALEASQTRTFRWEMKTDVLVFDETLGQLFEPASIHRPRDLTELLQRIHPEDRDSVSAAFQRCAHHGADLDVTCRLIPSDQRVRWIYAKGRTIHDACGQPACLMGAYTNITQQKWLEDAVRQKEIAETIIDNIPVMVVFYNSAGEILLVNEEFRRVIGWSTEEARATDIMAACYPDPEYRRMVWDFMMNPGSQWRDFRMCRRDGSELSTSWTNVTLSGGFQIGIGIDTTHRRILEQQRERLVRELREERSLLSLRNEQLRHLATRLTSAEQRERHRVARLLHENLQQILVAAQMGLHQLRRHEHESAARRRAERVGELIDEAVHVSRTLAVELYPPVLYDRGLGMALEWLARHFDEQHGLSVQVHADPKAEPGRTEARAFLFQVVRELLLNVVKHAETEQAWVSLERPEIGRIQLVVEDNGKGCEPERLYLAGDEHVGFGLTYIQQRIDLLGGSVMVRTAPGQGCRITIQLPKYTEDGTLVSDSAEPQGQTQPPIADRQEPGGLGGIRVLIADDHRIVRQGLAEMLHDEQDLQVVGEAADGQEAVALALRLRPDVIVMDVSMPKVDGIEASREILKCLPDVRIVGLSMHKDTGIQEAMSRAGAVTFLSKGGDYKDLVDAIRGRSEPQREY